jgi:fibronectin type 3 domain-containing protein
VTIGSSGSQTVTLTASGTGSVTITNVSIVGAGIDASGVVGLELTTGKTASLKVTFAPAATGLVSGSIKVTSNATNSPISIAVSGTGVSPASHSVALLWNAISGVAGYDVYRGSVSGGPYTILTSSPITTTAFTDTNVQAGQTYYYVVTSVGSDGVQSAYSSPASATIP